MKNQMWTEVEFSVNSAFWQRWGYEASLPFRTKNIADLQNIFAADSIDSWLIDNLVDEAEPKVLPQSDHDVLMVNMRNTLALRNWAEDKLLETGFSIVRVSERLLSVVRYGRCTDICPSNESLPRITRVMFHGAPMRVHGTEPLLHEKQTTTPRGGSGKSPRSNTTTSPVLQHISWFVSNPGRFVTANWWANLLIFGSQKLLAQGTRNSSVVKKLSLEEFLSLQIDEEGSVNWSWRANHMEALYREGETLRATLARLKKNAGLDLNRIVETKLESCVPEPTNLSYEFWRTGNNFFVYPFLYGYRHLVMPYHAANLYISYIGVPILYSAAYFEDLKPMSETEIEKFLRRNPISITGNSVTAGRHRISAMLGRLHRGEKYLPVYATQVPPA